MAMECVIGSVGRFCKGEERESPDVGLYESKKLDYPHIFLLSWKFM